MLITIYKGMYFLTDFTCHEKKLKKNKRNNIMKQTCPFHNWEHQCH